MSYFGSVRKAPSAKTIAYARGLWETNTGELLTFFTSSTQNTASLEYYYEVWGSASLSCNDERMFSVAYGHVSGSGSINQGGDVNDTAARAIYSQYKLLCLDGNETGLIMSGSDGAPMTDFYAININRDKFGDKLDPGNFQVNIAILSGSGIVNSQHTGSKVKVSGSGATQQYISLIDDSNDLNDASEYPSQTSIVRHLVSGSLTNGIYNSTNPHYYGKVFPSQGTLLLSAETLNQSASFNTVTGSNIAGDNAYKLFTAISGAAAVSSPVGFTARSVKNKNELYYFVTIPTDSFNHTNNPTYVSQLSTTKGKILNTRFVDTPKVYITTIGLYVQTTTGGLQTTELVAVGKMSRPVLKTPNTELSITVKLEY